jgi:Domain of unknown function (DUF4129)
MQPPPAPNRSTRLVVVGGALFVLLGVVAFASRSGFGGRSASASPSLGFVNWLFSILLMFVAVLICAAGYVYFFLVRNPQTRVRKTFANRVAQGLAFLALMLFVAAAVVYVRRHSAAFRRRLDQLGIARNNHAHHPAAGGAHRSVSFQWPVLFLFVALGLTLVTWYVMRRRHAAHARFQIADDETALAAVVAESIGDAIDDLEAEPDARRAVIAAYARMEGVLARNGLQRTPSETPLEYLRRLLLGLTARGDAVESLTGLFEEARFSGHQIDSGMKRDAIAALITIRDDLQGAGA